MFTRWVEEKLGVGMVEILREKAYAVTKMKPADKDELKKYLRDELKKMEALRKAGEKGRIDFQPWE